MKPALHVSAAVLAVAACAVPSVGAQGAQEPPPRPAVAVVDFEVAPGGWTAPPPQVGKTLAQLMLDRLVESGQLRVFSSAQAGPVNYLVRGSVTRFSTEDKNRTFGGGGFGLPFLAGFRRHKTEMVVSLMTRLVDVRTGEVVATAVGQGTSSRTERGLGGIGGARGPGIAGFGSSSSGARDALLDEALQRSVAVASAALLHAMVGTVGAGAPAGAPVVASGHERH